MLSEERLSELAQEALSCVGNISRIDGAKRAIRTAISEATAAANIELSEVQGRLNDAANTVFELRRKLAEAGIEGSPPPYPTLRDRLETAEKERDTFSKAYAHVDACLNVAKDQRDAALKLAADRLAEIAELRGDTSEGMRLREEILANQRPPTTAEIAAGKTLEGEAKEALAKYEPAEPLPSEVEQVTSNPWAFACSWYKEDEIRHAIDRQRHHLLEAIDSPVPTDVYSDEFVTWLTNQYRLAMAKGIQLATQPTWLWCAWMGA